MLLADGCRSGGQQGEQMDELHGSFVARYGGGQAGGGGDRGTGAGSGPGSGGGAGVAQGVGGVPADDGAGSGGGGARTAVAAPLDAVVLADRQASSRRREAAG